VLSSTGDIAARFEASADSSVGGRWAQHALDCQGSWGSAALSAFGGTLWLWTILASAIPAMPGGMSMTTGEWAQRFAVDCNRKKSSVCNQLQLGV
jgi:hypothetical protein